MTAVVGDRAARWRARSGYGRTHRARPWPLPAPVFPVHDLVLLRVAEDVDLTRHPRHVRAHLAHGFLVRTADLPRRSPHGRAGALYCQEPRP